jgi:hypothetical protein
LPDWFTNAAQIVAFARDLIFLLILLIGAVTLLLLYRKVAQLLEIVKRTAKSTEDMVAMVSENIAKPATSRPGMVSGIGKVAMFVLGLLRKKKSNDGG